MCGEEALAQGSVCGTVMPRPPRTEAQGIVHGYDSFSSQLPDEAREHLSCTLEWLCGQFVPHKGASGRVGGEEQGDQPLGLSGVW